MQDENSVHAVDEWLPLRWSIPLGFQQLLAAYASIIIAPLVLASALGWPADQTTYLLASGLLGSGVATLIQCLGIRGLPIGTRLPDIVAPDHTGATIDVHAARAGGPAVVVFYRSADW